MLAVKCWGPHLSLLMERNSFAFLPELEWHVSSVVILALPGLCEIFVKSRCLEVHINYKYFITWGIELESVVADKHNVEKCCI